MSRATSQRGLGCGEISEGALDLSLGLGAVLVGAGAHEYARVAGGVGIEHRLHNLGGVGHGRIRRFPVGAFGALLE